MSFEVTVKKTCPRCKRIENTSMSMEEAQKAHDHDVACDEAENGLPKLLNDTLVDAHPDIIIAVRDQKTGEYKVRSLRGLCHFPEAERNKGCADRVNTLLDEIFLKPNGKGKSGGKGKANTGGKGKANTGGKGKANTGGKGTE